MSSSSAPLTLFARLPLEIIPDILRRAASAAIHERRAWAVDIALVNYEAYRVVESILYHTMVITYRNHCRVHELFNDDSHWHVFRAVRRLSVPQNIFKGIDIGSTSMRSGDQETARFWDRERFLSAFSNTLEFNMELTLMEFLTPRPPLEAPWFSRMMDARAGVGLGALTHVSVYLLGLPELPWVDETIAGLIHDTTTLTHFAVNLRGAHFAPFEDIESVLRIAVDSERLVFIAVALSGREYNSQLRNVFEQRILQLNDRRLHLWFDEHPALLVEDRTRLYENEAWTGRDVWTEAKPVL